MKKKIVDKCATFIGSYFYYVTMSSYVIIFVGSILMSIILFLFTTENYHVVRSILELFFVSGPLSIWSYKKLRKH